MGSQFCERKAGFSYEAPATPANDFTWRPRPLPNMDGTAPDDFCLLENGATALLLRPEIFGDLTRVNAPSLDMYYNPGATAVAPGEMWAILDRARQRNIALRLVTLDPNGLGTQRLLAAGVSIDGTGRWLDPKVEARERK